jgi:uncharacterized heparinase superfamily protein
VRRLSGRSGLGNTFALDAAEWTRRRALDAARLSWRALSSPFHLAKSMEIAVPTRLLIAPPDLRTADPTVANEIYAGVYSFDGAVAQARGDSPFLLDAPTPAWRRALTGFAWLRHLRAVGSELARDNARALVQDFAETQRARRSDPAFEPPVVARRMMSLLAHSPMLLEGADARFFELFVELLAREARVLHRALASPPEELAERLPFALALAQYCVCAGERPTVHARAMTFLSRALEREILADGAPVSRDPQLLLDLLLDMTPLRQAFVGRGYHPPAALTKTLDSMLHLLKLLQHGDLSLARFNGMGETPLGCVASLLAQDEGRRPAPLDAPAAGYRRLQAGAALVIVDAGAPPPAPFARRAHAGCLSFELSIDCDPVVVNCGAPPPQNVAGRETARATAAHSTLTLDGVSSARVDSSGALRPGPALITAERRVAASGEALDMSHDGFVSAFGFVHERSLALTPDGARFLGQDRLRARPRSPASAAAPECALRFHLHPRVAAQFSAEGDAIELFLQGGAALLFEWSGARAAIEDSAFFATASGGVKSRQIVLRAGARDALELRWAFTRMGDVDPALPGGSQRRLQSPSADAPQGSAVPPAGDV